MPACIQGALADLPETLDETYLRTLGEINKADWEFAHRLFQFVAVASRPLRVGERSELLAFDFKVGPIPKFHEDWRMEDPVDAVLSACSCLLAVVDVEGSPVIQFSHFSVKEFLTSARLAEANDIIHRRYHVSMTPAHTLASQACLGTLLHLDQDFLNCGSVEDYPLAEYAAEHWVYHAQFEEVPQCVEDGMRQLFDPSNLHLKVCVAIHDPDRPYLNPLFGGDKNPWLFESPLHYAALWGLLSIVHFLVIELSQDVYSRSITYATPLHVASENGHKQVACFLLDCGVDVSIRDMLGKTPLYLASEKGHLDVADMLIERGADVSAMSDHGTPLHVALRWGNVEVAHMLIERGADVSAQDNWGATPLCLALSRGDVEAAHMLIERGADVSTPDVDGYTPLCHASGRGDVEVADMLIERGADVSVQDGDGKIPLCEASEAGHMDVTHLLIKCGARVSAQDEYGDTPLHLASQWGHAEVAHKLIEHGADVTAQNKDRKTPLHLASTHSKPHWVIPQQLADVARILLKHGANVTAQDADGMTPLDLASQDERLAEVAHILIQHGAGPGAH
jgi:ankyrin repeat protein